MFDGATGADDTLSVKIEKTSCLDDSGACRQFEKITFEYRQCSIDAIDYDNTADDVFEIVELSCTDTLSIDFASSSGEATKGVELTGFEAARRGWYSFARARVFLFAQTCALDSLR